MCIFSRLFLSLVEGELDSSLSILENTEKGSVVKVNIAQMIKFLIMKLVHPNSSSSSRLVYMDDHIYD